MSFKDFLKKSFAKDEEFKEMQKQQRMQQMLEERQKSSNQRELEKYIQEEKEKSIKKNLEEFREIRKKETWNPSEEDQILKQKNIFKGHKNILDQDFDLLNGGKQLFKMKGNIHKSGINKGTMSRGTMMKVNKIKKGGCGFIR